MKKDEITWVDLEKGLPSVTIARYGITLNSTATEIISRFEFARVGYHKENKELVIAAADKDQFDGEMPEGWFSVKDKITSHGYFRLNNKDLVRVITRFANLNLARKNRFMGEWDESEKILTVDLTKRMEKDIFSKKKQEIFDTLGEIW